MPYCIQCGSKMLEEDNYCMICGARAEGRSEDAWARQEPRLQSDMAQRDARMPRGRLRFEVGRGHAASPGAERLTHMDTVTVESANGASPSAQDSPSPTTRLKEVTWQEIPLPAVSGLAKDKTIGPQWEPLVGSGADVVEPRKPQEVGVYEKTAVVSAFEASQAEVMRIEVSSDAEGGLHGEESLPVELAVQHEPEPVPEPGPEANQRSIDDWEQLSPETAKRIEEIAGSLFTGKHHDCGEAATIVTLCDEQDVPQEEEDDEPATIVVTRMHHILTRQPDGERFELKLPCIIGRGKAADMIVTRDGHVGRKHARLMEENGEVVVLDLNSTNGTFVDGEELESGGKATLHAGQTLCLGIVDFVYTCELR